MLVVLIARKRDGSIIGLFPRLLDYVTFLTLFVLVAAGLCLVVFILGLPGRIAIARNHREAEAVYLMGLSRLSCGRAGGASFGSRATSRR